MSKSKRQEELETKIDELTLDLQRTRADFENYRKRSESDKAAIYQQGQSATILKLLPVIDTIERAVAHMPKDLKDHTWAQGIAGLMKNLDKSLANLNLERVEAKPGTDFDPAFHEAIQFDEEADGDKEVIADELQPGYLLNGIVIRHAMVKVTRQ
jgi:molecular chaperone GrpE